MGLLPEKYVQRELFIKEDFKKTDFWQKGVIFLNERVLNTRKDIFGLQDAKIRINYQYELKTGELKEEVILSESEISKSHTVTKSKIKVKLSDFNENIIRTALDKFEFYKFENLKKYFPYVKSIREFILSDKYLGNIEVEIIGSREKLDKLSQDEKLEIVLSVVKEIEEQAKTNISEYIGSTSFKSKLLREIFKDKILKIDSDDERAKGMEKIDLSQKEWYAQNNLYGTSEEQEFVSFIDSFIDKLKKEYSDIALLRNEKFFQLFDFDEGRPFEPDFIMILKKKNKVINIYQIFIEAKGDQFKDSKGRFENSKEGWKQKFLLEIENNADIERNLQFENEHFKLLGLPFYNKTLEKEFEEALKEKILGVKSKQKA
jgi:type III restriction enzyme